MNSWVLIKIIILAINRLSLAEILFFIFIAYFELTSSVLELVI